MSYDAGESNRVSVRWIQQGSAADQAGLMIGDVVLSYDGQRIFTMSELRALENTLEAGTTVPIVYQRGDEVIHSTVTRNARQPSVRGSVNGISFSPTQRAP
jgi:serine protease Do